MDASSGEDLDNGVAPPSYEDVVQDQTASRALAEQDCSHGIQPPAPLPPSSQPALPPYHRDGPPSYLKLFGMTSSVLQPPRVTFVTGPVESQRSVPNRRTQPSTTATTTTTTNPSCGSLYYEAATKSKPRTALYCVLFWIGLLLALAMIASGSWKHNEPEPKDATDVSESITRSGSFLLIFVLCHTLILLCGVFAKGTGKMEGWYWVLRMCHCGCYLWGCQLIVYSFVIWIGVYHGSIFPSSLVWFVVCCVIIQYLIVLYCCFELFYDLHYNNFLSAR